VPESLIGQNLTCPSCKVEFFATPADKLAPLEPESPISGFMPPAKLPFLKSSRRKLLEQRFEELFRLNGGTINKEAEDELNKNGIALGLDSNAGADLLKEHFLLEFGPIKQRMEDSFLLTDEDNAAIEQLQKKYNIVLTLGGDANLFRSIYLMEANGTLPQPMQSDLMLEGKEVAYYAVSSVWSQTRVHSHGYSGTSVSLPTGIKGVRFRFGGYTPMKTEEITALSSGTLCITSARLLFNGESRNTTVTLKKIIDGHIFADALKVEKSTGKPDYFSMKPPQARFILSLVGALKSS
jgi:hypothetical protein